MSAEGVRVSTTARLHLGFLDLAGDLRRRFGSIGLAIDGFPTEVRMRRAAQFAAQPRSLLPSRWWAAKRTRSRSRWLRW